MFKLNELVLGYFAPAKPGLETHWGLIGRRTLYDVIFQEATRKSNVLGIIPMSLNYLDNFRGWYCALCLWAIMSSRLSCTVPSAIRTIRLYCAYLL
jgi:hypothetical protein